MTLRRRLTRAEYEQLKANCAAKVNVQMERLQLSPSDVEKASVRAVLDQVRVPPLSGAGDVRLTAAISMPDLAAYRSCRTLPKNTKLLSLAYVLKCKPSELVARPYQEGRLLVQRHVDAVFEGRIARVEPSVAEPGNAWVMVRIMLPTEKAYRFAQVAQRQHVIEEMRRMGLNEDEIKANLEAPAPG